MKRLAGKVAIVTEAAQGIGRALYLRDPDGIPVELVDEPGALTWRPTDHGVRIDLPDPPDEQPAIALRLWPRSSVH